MRILGKRHNIVDDADKTNNRILLASARLFTIRGNTAVSMREIAEEIWML